MASDGTEPRTGRETRLLVLVVGVAVIVLLLLAQWRFPGSDLSMVSPTAAPFAGLAARATFDEMAGTLADVISRVSPLTIVVPLGPVSDEADDASGGGSDPPVEADAPAPAEVLMLALRVRHDLALLYVPAGMEPRSRPDLAIDVAARDAVTQIVLLRVAPSANMPDTLSAAVRTFPGFSFAAAVDATPVGPTVQPVFIGRAETVADPRWSHALVMASVAPGLKVGTLVFSLNNRFVGLVVDADGGPMVVPAPALETLVQALEAGEGAPQ